MDFMMSGTGVVMDDGVTLEDLGLMEDSTVQVVLHPPWKLLTRHRVSEGMFLPGEVTKNRCDLEAALFADLDINYDSFRDDDGKLLLKIVWPAFASDTDDPRLEQNHMIWSQGSTPLQSSIKDYEPISIPYPGT